MFAAPLSLPVVALLVVFVLLPGAVDGRAATVAALLAAMGAAVCSGRAATLCFGAAFVALGLARTALETHPALPSDGPRCSFVRLAGPGGVAPVRAIPVLLGPCPSGWDEGLPVGGGAVAVELRPAWLRIEAWPSEEPPKRGATLWIWGVLVAAEPGRSDDRPTLHVRRPHHAVLASDAPTLVERALRVWDGAVAVARSRIRLALDRHSSPRFAALHRALIVGERDQLDPADQRAFVRTGTVHLISISGVHITAGALPMWWVSVHILRSLAGGAAPSGWPERWAPVLALLGAAFYVAVAGSPLPAFRSLGMLAVMALARLLGRRPLSWNVLLASAAFILWCEPAAARNLGFHLSYLSVAGLLVAGTLSERCFGSRPRPVRAAATLLLASIAATVFTAPLLAWHWEAVPLAGLWANSLAIPLLGEIAVALLLGAAALGAVHPDLAAPPIVLAELSERAGMFWVHLCADPRWSPSVAWPVTGGGLALAILGLGILAAEDGGPRGPRAAEPQP